MGDRSALRTNVSWRSRSIAAAAEEDDATRSTGVRPLVRRSDPPPPPSPEAKAFLDAVVRGLGRVPKTLPVSYMFDPVGSRLYACLRSIDELGVTGPERAIWRTHAREIADVIGPRATFVDPHAGDGHVAALLAPHLRTPIEIVVADRLAGGASRAATAVRGVSPGAPVLALDVTDPWSVRPPRGVARTVVHLGGGLAAEVDPSTLRDRLVHICQVSGEDGALLVGVPLRGCAAPEAAYVDRAGVAASFDLNLLARINRELRGGFQLSAWGHRAIWNEADGRVEMQLVSKRAQWAAVGPHWFAFATGEGVTTMVAYRYTLEGFASLAASAGWRLERVFLDPERTYALVLCCR